MKHGKTLLCLALALLLALALAATASAADPTVVTLDGDAAMGSVTLPGAGQALIVDLNGHTLTGGGAGSGLSLDGSLTVRDSSAEQTGKVVGCRFVIRSGGALTLESGTMTGCTNSASGAIAYIMPGGSVTMTGGAITGCSTASNNSGTAIAVVGGSFTMSGGSISDCSSGSNGGAVCVSTKDGSVGAFTMTGGSITGNVSVNAGGGVWLNGGAFTMSGGVISGNTAGTSGGGVSLTSGTFELTAGEISGNASTTLGGGVYLANGTFNMSGGEIAGNESLATGQANSRGGGVYLTKGTFTMTDGVISGNAAYSAGGVGLVGGTFTMSGGSVTGNKAGKRNSEGVLIDAGYGIGGGAIGTWGESVRVNVTGGSLTDNSAFVQGGAVAIYAGQVSLENVSVTGNKLVNAGKVYGGAFLVGGTSSSADEEKKLHRLIIGDGTVVSGNGTDAVLPSGSYLYGTAGFAGRGGEIVMNGGTVSGNDNASGNGAFYLWNNSPGHMSMSGGTITGNTTRGGTVWVAAGADFTMTGGSITGNTASTLVGGGVRVEGGAFTMTGGEITDNQTTASNMSGGGVAMLNAGTVDISGGSIAGNTATGSGGGLYASGTGTVTLSGDGVIAGNSSNTTKCDVFLTGNVHFVMTGGTLGARNSGQNAFWVWSDTASHMISIDISGGSVLNTVGASGSNPENRIDLWDGDFYSIAQNHRGFTVYGGRFYDPVYVMECAGAENAEIFRTGEETFGFTIAPALTRQIGLNAAGTQLDAALDAAQSAWTFYSGAETTAVRVPVTARFAVGEHVTEGLAVTASGGQYKVSAPIAEADKGGQYLLTLLDGEGQSIRAFAGHVDDIEAAGPGGDLSGDGKINAKDIVLLQRSVAGGYGVTLTAAEADLTGDGKINAKDIVLLQRFVAGGYDVTLGGGTAVLRDDPHADDELNLLFIGNSFCYYWVEELYGLMDAAGFENVTICNVYYSGCSLKQHWTWLLGGQKNYEFYVTDKDGRRQVGGLSDMDTCFSYKNWDTVEIQQGSGGGSTGSDEASYLAIADAHLSLLNKFLIRERAPHADYYWQNSWTSEVARTGDSIESFEDQQRIIGYTLPVARTLQARYGMTYAPCGVAWQYVRGDERFAQLIEVDGKHLTTRIYQGRADYDDYYHDGDRGGGQFLNACVWFETITHVSCLDNTYRPSYVFKGTDYSLSEEQIAFLKEAAHQAVLSEYGADYYR